MSEFPKTPSEKVLTNINPEDHWHHYGIWNPWTKVAFEGDTLEKITEKIHRVEHYVYPVTIKKLMGI